MSGWTTEEAIAMRDQQGTTEQLAHCVLCGKQSEARVEDAPADAVNDDIIVGNMIHRIPGNPGGVCAACAHEVTYHRACALEWIHPGGHLSSGMRLTVLLHRLNSLAEYPASYALNRFAVIVEPEALSHFEREMDREEERQRTAARNAAILHDANHDCREQR